MKGGKPDQPDDPPAVKAEKSLSFLRDSSCSQQQADRQILQEADATLASRAIVPKQPSDPISQSQVLANNNQQCKSERGAQLLSCHAYIFNQQVSGYNDWSLGGQNMHNLHPSYMFNAPDINNEYNLLNEFLTSSLLDDCTIFPNDDVQVLNSDPSLSMTLAASTHGNDPRNLLSPQQGQHTGTPQKSPSQVTNIIPPKNVKPTDKEDDKYYMTIADPSGNDTPEERMNKVFIAKYNAGMLRPFNYIQGYARLHHYMDQYVQPSSRQRILRQLDKFRPKFRERMQSLTDMELTFVEMWFERSLMEYDRVFASMAIPACCWRRTGEIFRGNKEMAELIHVPIEKLRDASLSATGRLSCRLTLVFTGEISSSGNCGREGPCQLLG